MEKFHLQMFSFKYNNDSKYLLNYINRRGQMDTVQTVLSGTANKKEGSNSNNSTNGNYSQARENALEKNKLYR